MFAIPEFVHDRNHLRIHGCLGQGDRRFFFLDLQFLRFGGGPALIIQLHLPVGIIRRQLQRFDDGVILNGLVVCSWWIDNRLVFRNIDLSKGGLL